MAHDDDPIPIYAQDIHTTFERKTPGGKPKRPRKSSVGWWWIAGGLITLLLLSRLIQPEPGPAVPNTSQAEAGQVHTPTVADEGEAIDRAAIFALSTTDWPSHPRIMQAVREGVQEIHKVCPDFEIGTIGQGLALKYETPWATFVQKADRMGQPPETVVAAALNLVHLSMLTDLKKNGCGPQTTANAQTTNTEQTASRVQGTASKGEQKKPSKEELETMVEGPMLATKTLEDWAYAPKRFRLEAARGMVDAELNYPIKRYPDDAIELYAQAVASCVDGVTNETSADLTTVNVGSTVLRCHRNLKKRWDFGPVTGLGSSLGDALQ